MIVLVNKYYKFILCDFKGKDYSKYVYVSLIIFNCIELEYAFYLKLDSYVNLLKAF